MEQKKIFNRTGVAFFVFLAVAIGLQLLLGILLGIFAPLAIYRPWVMWLVSMLPMYLVAFPICWLIMKRLPSRELYQHDMKLTTWCVLLLMFLFWMLAGGLAGTVVNAIISALSGVPMVDNAQTILSMGNPLFLILFVVIIGPLVEEVIFRKILIDRLIVFGDRGAILISAIMFALFHGNFGQLFYAFAAGLLFGYVYVRTGKLKYNVTLHMAVNFLNGVLPTLLMKALDLDHLIAEFTFEDLAQIWSLMGALVGVTIYELLIFAGAIAGLVFLILYRKRFVFRKGEMQMGRKEVLKRFFTSPGMLLFIAICIVLFAINMAG